jgi:tetratricopeptide (TPR) repeat protein
MLASYLLILVLAQANPPVQALVRRAQEDFAAGRYAEAEQELQQVVRVDPTNSTLWFYLGVSSMRLNHLDSAISAFQNALAISPKEAPSYFNLGLLYWRKKDVGKALQTYRKGLELDPMDEDANQNYAVLLMDTGKYKEAIEPLRRLEKLESSNLSVRVGLIESSIKAGEKSEGQAEVDKLLTSHIASPADEVKLAGALIEDGAPEIAEKVFRAALGSAPDLADAHGGLGFILLQKDDYKNAVTELGRAVQLDPDSSKYAMGLAEALLLWKHNSTLLSFLKAIQPRFGKLPEFQYKLALAYYLVAQYPNAIDALEKLLAQNPPRQDVIHYFLGNSYLAMGQFQKADACYRMAIQINPKDPSYYESYATLLRKEGAGHLDEAIALLEKARQLDPSGPRAGLQLALCYELKHELPKAQSLLEEALTKQPELLPAHVALARVYFRQGEKDQGEREKAIIARLEAEQQKQKLQIKTEAPGQVISAAPTPPTTLQ